MILSSFIRQPQSYWYEGAHEEVADEKRQITLFHFLGSLMTLSMYKRRPIKVCENGDQYMFMTANRIKIQGEVVLKLNIHECDENAIPFLDNLGINKIDNKFTNCRYIHIHRKEDFLSIRAAIFEKYEVVEKGPKAYLTSK